MIWWLVNPSSALDQGLVKRELGLVKFVYGEEENLERTKKIANLKSQFSVSYRAF